MKVNKINKPLIQNVYKYFKSKNGKTVHGKTRIGVMIACVSPDDPEKVTMGFSLCHPTDKVRYIQTKNNTIPADGFDWIKNPDGTYTKLPNFGRNTAITRALRWSKQNKQQFIPYKLRKDMKSFIERAKKYYQDKEIMPWIIESVTAPIPVTLPGEWGEFSDEDVNF